ncbi:MAG: PorT family protein [Bacteroidales bacterium]|nr:PorT family protein [Bacteroidales bacterium]
MKKLVIVVFCLMYLGINAQVVTEETKRKFTFGLDVFTDMWQDTPTGFSPATINPGVNVFGSYNYIFGESNFSFSPGMGIGVHNLFNSSQIRTTTDSTYFQPIPDSINYKKSKFVATYLDIPLELRFKSKSDFRFAVGFKFGFLLQAHTKYKGDDYLEGNTQRVIYKKAKINYMEKNRYGFTARIGYKWFNLYGYYQLSTLFEKNKGPEMYPISIGLTIIPF